MIIRNTKTSQEKRFSSLTLNECLENKSMQNTRIAENHGLDLLEAMLLKNFPNLDVEIECDQKLKKSAVAISKSSRSDCTLKLKIASLQVSYKTSYEAVKLAKDLVTIWEDEKGKLLKFPTGDKEKGFDPKYQEVAKAYNIGRYDGFDKSIATGSNHVCTNNACGYDFGAVNNPNPDKPYSCPRCKSPMLSTRVNYNYRKDNTNGRHWGTLSDKELLSNIDVQSIAFTMLTKKQQDELLKDRGLDRSVLPLHARNVSQDANELNIEVQQKVSIYDEMSYKEVSKICKKRGIKNLNKDNKERLIVKLVAYDKENIND